MKQDLQRICQIKKTDEKPFKLATFNRNEVILDRGISR